MKTAGLLALIFAAALLLAACGEVGPRAQAGTGDAAVANEGSASAGCGAVTETGAGVRTLQSGGRQRGYRLYVPSGYNPGQATALVLNFHGFGSNARQQETYSDYPSLAEREGFIVATPEGTNRPQRWYIYGEREPGYVDDFAFVEALIDELSATLCIDAGRVYATGISNGGGMASQLACRLGDRIAAIALVAGEPYSELLCRDADRMPIIAFHGTEDELVPFEGGATGRFELPARGVRHNMRGWAEHNGCEMTLQRQRIAADVVLESYGGCAGGADVQLYVIEGGGHTWPGATANIRDLGRTTQSISASELSWRFFAAHPKP